MGLITVSPKNCNKINQPIIHQPIIHQWFADLIAPWVVVFHSYIIGANFIERVGLFTSVVCLFVCLFLRYNKKKYLELQRKFMSGTRRYRNIKHRKKYKK